MCSLTKQLQKKGIGPSCFDHPMSQMNSKDTPILSPFPFCIMHINFYVHKLMAYHLLLVPIGYNGISNFVLGSMSFPLTSKGGLLGLKGFQKGSVFYGNHVSTENYGNSTQNNWMAMRRLGNQVRLFCKEFLPPFPSITFRTWVTKTPFLSHPVPPPP